MLDQRQFCYAEPALGTALRLRSAMTMPLNLSSVAHRGVAMRNSKKIIIAVCLGGSMSVAAWAGPVEDGIAAHKRGDDAEALRLFRSSASQGKADGQNALGVMYLSGAGVTRDTAEALRWFRLSAAQGYAEAQYDLGEMYQNGEGIAEDDAEALRLFRASAAQGNADGQKALGTMYEFGIGVTKDPSEALRWYKLAAAQGDADAADSVARLTQQN